MNNDSDLEDDSVEMKSIAKFYMNKRRDIMTKQTRIDYFQSLADALPEDLENRELLYEKYQEHIETIRQEEEDD